MSRKYIKQYLDQNFVFPNNDIYEYDTEIVHDINNNSVSGTVTNISATTVSASSITITHDWTWDQNGAEVWVNPDGTQVLLSVHVLAPGQDYYKPWRMVNYVSTGTTGNTSYSGSNTVVITPTLMGLDNLPSGEYFLEFRFVGHRAIYPACGSITLALPTPTPTPTPTLTPTITPTRTPDITTTPTPTPTPTPGDYILYLADQYECLYPGCNSVATGVVVALPASHLPNYGKFYPADTPDGYAYVIYTTTTGGPGLILQTINFTSCTNACAI
jgi:hypothetical protein